MSSVGPVREYLRRAIAESHEHLDTLADQMNLRTKQGYARFLAAQAAALVPVEAALEAGGVAHLLPDWPERRRSAALKADLDALGVSVLALKSPTFNSDEELLGAAYVLEGSRLGARVVLTRIGRSAQTQFLRHGEGRNFWQSFLAVLESNRSVRRNPEFAAASALSVLDLFLRTTAAQTSERIAAQ